MLEQDKKELERSGELHDKLSIVVFRLVRNI